MRGIEHLDRVRGQRVVIFANHLSYSDANAIDVLLQKTGGAELADRMTVIAGPKVFSNLRRRFSSLCFGTIKVPQTSARASDEAVMTPRQIALAARRSIEVAHERLRLGEALLVLPEGTRSRAKGDRPNPLLARRTRADLGRRDYNRLSHEPGRRYTDRPVPGRRVDWRRRNGRSLSGA